jgi:ABC-type Mn2+/Zn2+ transport system permease subunit
LKILLAGWAIGFLASVFGVLFSYRLDIPTAPLIVASLSVAFFIILIWRSRKAG